MHMSKTDALTHLLSCVHSSFVRCVQMKLLAMLFLVAPGACAVRLVTVSALPGVAPTRAVQYLATPSNWPALVLSSWSVRGDDVDLPFAPGQSVEEIFGLPPLLPLEVTWTCTAADNSSLVFDSPDGLAGIASDCQMEFQALPDGAGGSTVKLTMSYEPLSPLATVAQPILAIDNAIALKLNLPSKLSPLGSADPIAGPLVAVARQVGLLPAQEEDGWTGEPTAWAESDSVPQRLSELSQRWLGGFKQFAAEAVAGDYDAAQVDAALDETIGAGGCVVFAFAACPFCKKAKSLLDAKGASYEWVLLDEREDGAALRARLGSRTGRTSVPSVWIGMEYLGGLNDGLDDVRPGLVTLDQRGELDTRLQAVGALPA